MQEQPGEKFSLIAFLAQLLSNGLAILSLIIAGLSYRDSGVATEISRQALNVTTLPSLTLGCSYRLANVSRKAFSQNVVVIAPAGLNISSVQDDWSEAVAKPDFDMVADQDVWACVLHNYSRLPILNVALRVPLVIKDNPSSNDQINYVICLHEVPSIQSDGDYKFELANGVNISQCYTLRCPQRSRSHPLAAFQPP